MKIVLRDIFAGVLEFLKKEENVKVVGTHYICTQSPMQVHAEHLLILLCVTETHWHHLVMKPGSKTKGQDNRISQNTKVKEIVIPWN